MADLEIRSLRVSAQMDASQYTAGAAQKSAADKSMVASGQQAAQAIGQVGTAATETVTKISQAGDVMSRLSRQFVDGYAAAQRATSAQLQLANGIERGKISMEQALPILEGITRKYGVMGDAAIFMARGQTEAAAAVTRLNAKLAEQRNLNPSNQNQNQGGLARFGALNAASQFQDIAVTAAMGQSPFTIALQQGTQLGQALQMEMGDQGAKGLVKGLAAAFQSLLSPVNLLAIGLTGIAAVAIEFGSKLLPQIKSLKDATDDQRKAVNDLAEAYGNADLKANDFYHKSIIASESGARRSTADLQKSATAEDLSVQQQLGSPFTVGRGRETLFGVKPEFSQFGEAISVLNGQIRAGRPDFDAFEKSISDVVANNPGLQTTADKILGIVAAATAAAAQLHNTSGAIDDINRRAFRNFDREQQAGRDQSVMSQRFGDDPFAQQREQQRQKIIALKEAQDERNRSLDRTVALAQLDASLTGKATPEAAGFVERYANKIRKHRT
ncbi:phage tail length tape measure family protein [Mesorhizobium sp. WSM4976]|uniref:phage tail length tape measure family protein n=1 Tax=Mesorhizobium sp. WSM4976 TaxID=3038549 RepID=UPI002416BF72|nr:phage tail length tape measure family protein [Mesorhizobium sp. WSM4976]MDG4898047.1 phage tail length tape measure family protein [Mesorhizobium sp. WSM4976]